MLSSRKEKIATTRLIGLTGGIGSGKSTAGELLQKLGFRVFSLDTIGKELSTSPAGLHLYEQFLGKDVFRDGQIDRAKTAAKLFSSAQLRSQFESQFHPLVWKTFLEQLRTEKEVPEVAICESALIFEGNFQRHLAATILVVAPFSQRKNRVLARPGMDLPLFEKIVASQWSDEIKRPLATFVVDNETTIEALEERLKILAPHLRRLA